MNMLGVYLHGILGGFWFAFAFVGLSFRPVVGSPGLVLLAFVASFTFVSGRVGRGVWIGCLVTDGRREYGSIWVEVLGIEALVCDAIFLGFGLLRRFDCFVFVWRVLSM